MTGCTFVLLSDRLYVFFYICLTQPLNKLGLLSYHNELERKKIIGPKKWIVIPTVVKLDMFKEKIEYTLKKVEYNCGMY